MERLTGWKENGRAYVIGCPEFELPEEANKVLQNLADKHAVIEDILGDSYDLDRLRELVEADKVGRCVVLPCDPGQVVWAANSFGVSSHQIRMLVRDKDGDFACSMIKFPLEDFGRRVFMSREEADAALRRKQE